MDVSVSGPVYAGSSVLLLLSCKGKRDRAIHMTEGTRIVCERGRKRDGSKRNEMGEGERGAELSHTHTHRYFRSLKLRCCKEALMPSQRNEEL